MVMDASDCKWILMATLRYFLLYGFDRAYAVEMEQIGPHTDNSGISGKPSVAMRRSYGPYTRTAQLARPRRRTSVSRFLLTIRTELTAHCGGQPSITQKLMIERICMTLLRIELMDRDALNSDTPGEITERQARDYLAWVNTAGRLLRTLGVEPASGRSLSPGEALAKTYVGATL
jgi:hypothetical protein